MKIVLAYSGGLDTSVILSWLKEKYDAEIIAFCANIGQEEELRGLEAKAKRTGASKCHIVDLQEEFARDFIFPMVQAGAVYESQYFLGTSIARPLIAKGMIEIARKEKAEAIAHGATGKGNDQVRFELTAACLAPQLDVIAPWRDGLFRDQFPGRAEMIAYCEKKRIPVQASAKKPYSMDRNLLHLSFEAGILEDPWMDVFDSKNKDMFKLSVAPEDAPDKAEYVTLDFHKGNCVAVNGKALSPLGVMRALNKLGGKHGVGICYHLVENRFVGIKSRGVYEAPGMELLGTAYAYLLQLVLDRRSRELFDQLSLMLAKQVYQGYGYDLASKVALDAVKSFAALVTGTISVSLYKGNTYFASATDVPHSLYSEANASMEAIGEFDHADSEGFLRVLSVSARALAAMKQVARK